MTAAAERPRFRVEKRRNVARRVLLAFVVLAVLGFVVFRMRPKAVTTAPIVRGTAIDAVYATATVEALDRVTVKAKVAGSVGELKVREGDVVKKGDLLAVIDSPTLKYQLDRGKAEQWAATQQASSTSPQIAAVEAQAKMTEASLKTARDERDRLDKLVASGSMPRAELDRAVNNVAMLEAQLASQRAQARALKIDLMAKSTGQNAAVSELAARLADAEVRSPMDGVVLQRQVDPGELVPQNGVMFKIGDVSRLILECSVDEADIGRLSVGKKAAVSLYAFPKRAFHGQVFEILPDADRAKKSFLVKVRLEDAPAGMRSGMSAEVNIVVDEHPNALLAPAEAIDATSSAFVVEDDHVAKRALTVGIRDMLRVEVLAGASEGEQVVIAGADGLKPGMRVRATVKPLDMNTPLPKASANAGGSL